MAKLKLKSEDIKRYEWPAVIKKNELYNTVLIEICCPHFGPVRLMGNTLCQPYCQSCHNGKCIAPEVCQCYDGYVLSDNKDCVFTCPISCLNGRCNLLRGGCLCNSGYKLDETGQFCRPICRAGCGINPLHNCTAPD
uniref:Wnt inhibitory factor 1 n=1 Tax=Musca domestica TaxID=7370 RepID=A0A1I8MJU6_MUSDO